MPIAQALSLLAAIGLTACASSSGPKTGGLAADEPEATPATQASRVDLRGPSEAAPRDDAESPILVELFTSQGCNSCPPADALLSRLGSGEDVAGTGRPIVPLSFHVDYWNYLGWSDPFSSPRWSARQHRYATRVSGGRVYTPQLVIHGRAHAVGSQLARISRELRGVARAGVGDASLEARAERVGDRIRITASAARGRHQGALTAWAAVYENGVETSVPRGENAGRVLRNDHVVRAFESVFEMATDGGAGGGTIEIAMARSWRAANLGVVVFLQDPKTLHIHAVRALSPNRL